MDYYGVGFSNIRLQNDRNNYIYKYNSNVNTFPEEVFVHEFLHSLERDLIENGYKIPALHDSDKYGYENQPKVGLRKWYGDYMTKNIVDGFTGTKVGLDNIVYKLKTVKQSDFNYSIKLEDLEEDTNPFTGIIIALKNGFSNIKDLVVQE